MVKSSEKDKSENMGQDKTKKSTVSSGANSKKRQQDKPGKIILNPVKLILVKLIHSLMGVMRAFIKWIVPLLSWRNPDNGHLSLMRSIRSVFICLFMAPIILTQVYRFVDPISTLMLYRYITFQSVAREWRDIETISDRLKASIMMSEDGQYCHHNGIDWDSLEVVVEKYIEGEKVRGASTITMQVAKNLFLWPSRSVIRKGLELPLALYIDFSLPKKRIFEIYLNIAEFGPNGIFGVEAGAQYHFKKSSEAMSRTQAALLAATLPNPHIRNPRKPTRRMNHHARIVRIRAQHASPWIKCAYND